MVHNFRFYMQRRFYYKFNSTIHSITSIALSAYAVEHYPAKMSHVICSITNIAVVIRLVVNHKMLIYVNVVEHIPITTALSCDLTYNSDRDTDMNSTNSY